MFSFTDLQGRRTHQRFQRPSQGWNVISAFPPQAVEVSRTRTDAKQLQVKEQLIFVVGQVFEISHQECQQGLTLRNKYGPDPAAQVRLRAMPEALCDVPRVHLNSFPRLIRCAEMVNGKRLQLFQFAQLRGKRRMQGRTKTCDAGKEVPQ